MEFHKKYPNANIYQEVEQGIVKFRKLEPCWHCSNLTEFWQMDFDAPLCSHECVQAKISEFESTGRIKSIRK